VDTGNIILQKQVPIGEDETAGELQDRLASFGSLLVLETVRLIESGNVVVREQDNSLATPAPKIFKEHCQIDWSKSTREIHNFVRGLSPHPCAYTHHKGKLLKVYRTKVVETESRPGKIKGVGQPGEAQIVDGGLWIQTGKGKIAILEIQQEGKRRMRIEEFLRGYRIQKGDRLE